MYISWVAVCCILCHCNIISSESVAQHTELTRAVGVVRSNILCCSVLHCNMVQEVAVCCGVLQCVALQYVAVGFNVLQCFAVCNSVTRWTPSLSHLLFLLSRAMSFVAECCSVLQCSIQHVAVQIIAACCSVLQRVAACCSVLQRVAACGSLWSIRSCTPSLLFDTPSLHESFVLSRAMLLAKFRKSQLYRHSIQ